MQLRKAVSYLEKKMAIHKLIYGISQTGWRHITTRQSSHTDFMLSRLTDIRQPTDQLIPNVMHDGHTKDKESPYLRKGTTKRIKKRNRSGKDKKRPTSFDVQYRFLYKSTIFVLKLGKYARATSTTQSLHAL